MKFEFLEKKEVFDQIRQITENMQFKPMNRSLTDSQPVYENYDEKVVRKFLKKLNPHNCLFIVSSPSFEYDPDSNSTEAHGVLEDFFKENTVN